MSLIEFSHEFQVDKILEGTMFQGSLIIGIGEEYFYGREITEEELYMPGGLSRGIRSPWSNGLNDSCFEKDFGVLVHLSSRNTEELRELIRLEEVSEVHRQRPHEFYEYGSLFFEHF